MSTILQKWVPFEQACRLRTLQQGALAVGNTQQNIANLKALAITEANAPTTHWARWNPVLTYKLQIQVRLVPGYTAPPGTGYANVLIDPTFSLTSALQSSCVFNGTLGTKMNMWGYVSANVASAGFGSISGSPTVGGAAIEAICEDTSEAAQYLILQGTQTQNVFTKLQFTDSAGAQTYLAASAASFSTTAISGYSVWRWTNNATNGYFPTSGNPYTITIS